MKDYIKKLIVSIVFIVFLIILFVIVKGINDNRKKDDVSLVKRVISEKHKNVKYINDSKYIYTFDIMGDLYKYSLYDLSGNKIYTIIDEKEIDIVSMTKNYFITYNDYEYHLYNTDYEEITSGEEISSINDYLVKVEDEIIDLNNNVLFKDVETISLYNDKKIININDKYLTDKKGNILFKDVSVKEEIKSSYITDYLIIERNNKYYTFFVRIGKIIGDGFDYYVKTDKIYITNNNTIYRVYKTGLRKKINNNKEVEKLFIKSNNNNDIEFENGYKTIKNNNDYYLIDNNNKEIFKSKDQIILYNTKIKKGLPNKEIVLYNLKTKKHYKAERKKINNKFYYLYNNVIISSDFKEKYSSKEYINCYKKGIVYKNKNNIVFYNLKNNKKNIYGMEPNEHINKDIIIDKVVIVEGQDRIVFFDLKGNKIKKMKDKKIVDYYEINNKILFITEVEKDGIKYRGSYLAE